MGPVTRSMTRDHFVFTTGFEKIADTLDPIQKTFVTTPFYISYWRYVLYQRYVGAYAPPTLLCTWNDYTYKHAVYNDCIPNDYDNIPAKIVQSTLKVVHASKPRRKLLTVHIYYTTNNILVQGRACGDWVNQEFKNLRTIVHTMAASSRSPLAETGDVVCPVSAQPAIDCQAPMLDTPTTRPMGEQTPTTSPAGEQTPTTSPAGDQAPTTSPVEEQAPITSPALLIEEVPKNDDSLPPSPISHLQISPVEGSTNDCSLPSPQTSNHAHPPPPNSFNEDFPPATKTTPTETADEQLKVTVTTIDSSTTTPPPTDSSTTTPPATDSSTTTPPTTDSSTITPTTDSSTTTSADIVTTVTSFTDTPSVTVRTSDDTDIFQSDGSKRTAADKTNSDTTVITNDNSTSHTTNICDHSDCVPMTEFLRTVHSLQAEISALRSSLQEARQTFKIELDAQSTKLSQIFLSNTSPNKTNKTAHRSQSKTHNKSTQTGSTTSINQVQNKSTSPSQLQNPPPSVHPSSLNQLENKSTSPSQLQNPPPFHPNSTPQSQSADSETPLPERPLSHTSVARETTSILFGDFTVERVDLSRSTPPSVTSQKVCARDLTVAGLTDWLKHQTPNNNVKQATFHVGMNDCCDTTSATEASVSKKQWGSLISQFRRVFPRAQLQASSIIPAWGQTPLKFIVGLSNDHLQEACRDSGVKYINHCYTFTAQSGAPKKALYSSTTLPSKRGIELMVRSLYPPRRSPLLPTPSRSSKNYIPRQHPPKFSHPQHQPPPGAATDVHMGGQHHSLRPPPLMNRTEFPELTSHRRRISSLLQSSGSGPKPPYPPPSKPRCAGPGQHGSSAPTAKRPGDHSSSTVAAHAGYGMGTQRVERITSWPYGGMCRPLPRTPWAPHSSAPPPPPFPLFPPPPPFLPYACGSVPPTWYGWPFIPQPLSSHRPSTQ